MRSRAAGLRAGPSAFVARVVVLGLGQLCQLLVPLSFEAVGDQPVFRARQQELPLGQFGRLAGALDLRPPELIDLRLPRPQLCEDLQRHLEGDRCHRVENTWATASSRPVPGTIWQGACAAANPAALADVNGGDRVFPADRVAHGHALAGATAEYQALQEGDTLARRTAPAPTEKRT